MAIDTRDKRASALSNSLPWRPLPGPDAAITKPDRQFVSHIYSGIAVTLEWTVRASIVGLTLVPLRVGLFPTGTLTQKRRQAAATLYSNILADSSSPPPAVITLARAIGRALVRSLGRSI